MLWELRHFFNMPAISPGRVDFTCFSSVLIAPLLPHQTSTIEKLGANGGISRHDDSHPYWAD